MRMRQFLIALAAAVLLAGLAVPAAGQKPEPSGDIVPLEFNAYEAGDYPGSGPTDCLVTAPVEITSNVKAELYHKLSFETTAVENTVSLNRPDGTVEVLQLLVEDRLGTTFDVDYYGILSAAKGGILDEVPSDPPGGMLTVQVECLDLPVPSLMWGTETSGKNWTATVWAVAFPDISEFSLTGQFTPGIGPEPGDCVFNPDNENTWECEWTSIDLDKRTDDMVTFEVIDPQDPAYPTCDPIEINRGEGGSVLCDPPPTP